MKYSQPSLYPFSWSITTKLSIAMLSIALMPMGITVYYSLTRQNKESVLAIGAVVVITALLLSRRITRSTRFLIKAARSLERGNFAPQALAEVAYAKDDVGYVARVFSQMAARVKAAQEQQIRQQVTEVLLRELSNRDLNWLATVGQHREIDTGTVLVREGQSIRTFHIVLDGTLTMMAAQFDGSYLNRAVAQRNAEQSNREIARLSSGEVVGEQCLIADHAVATATIEAVEPSLVLSISQQELATKLKQDVGFAARFYRAMAILLSHRLHRLVDQIGCSSLTQEQSSRDVLFVLGALNDSDIDWLVAIGQRQKLSANTTLIHQGRPVDALYILLNGSLVVSTFEGVCNPFVRAFSVAGNSNTPGQEIAILSKGEIVGETPFLDAHLPPATVTALQDSLVLSIPRLQLAIKLQQDAGFAVRFYQVLANLLSNRLQELLGRLGYISHGDRHEQTSNGAIASETELNFSLLDQMAIAGTRFDWMLKRLGGIEPV